jgi:hypothetical protein
MLTVINILAHSGSERTNRQEGAYLRRQIKTAGKKIKLGSPTRFVGERGDESKIYNDNNEL